MNAQQFTPIALHDADLDLLADYALYCDAKIDINEMPYGFEQWQIADNDMKDKEQDWDINDDFDNIPDTPSLQDSGNELQSFNTL